MRVFLDLLLRCVLAFGLVFVPVSNAMSMAAMAASHEDPPSCHASVQAQQNTDDKNAPAASQCHCAMAICLPTDAAAVTHPGPPSDHPQTVRRLDLGQVSIPEIPPPQPLS